MICTECNKDEDCRPYGMNGAMICFSCGMKNEEQTSKNFLSQLDAAAQVSGVVFLGEETGPRPMRSGNH
jgi:hypothetical protein